MMNNSQFLTPTIVIVPPPPIKTSFEPYRLILPSDVNSPDKAGMIWLRPKQSDGGMSCLPEYITHAVVYPIALYAQKDTAGNWRHSTVWRVHPDGRADYHDAHFSDSVLCSGTVRKFGSSGVTIVESRHFSKFAEFLRLQHSHAKETMEVVHSID